MDKISKKPNTKKKHCLKQIIYILVDFGGYI